MKLEREMMGQFKKAVLKLLFLPAGILLLLVLISAGLLVYTFTRGSEESAIAYGAYLISAYTLTAVCMKIPALWAGAKAVLLRSHSVSRYAAEPQYRVKVSLYGSLGINVLYGLLQTGSGFYFHSVWFHALAGYYVLLAVMRFFLLKETVRGELGKDLFREYLHYRLCGVLLLLMNVTLGVIVFYIVWQNRGFAYNEIVTIAMAVYTFFAVGMAVENLVKYRRHKSPVMSAAKVISLAAAIVSILSLETAMIAAFGEQDSEAFRQVMTASTGGVVCITVLSMAVYMIVRSTGEINRLRDETGEDAPLG